MSKLALEWFNKRFSKRSIMGKSETSSAIFVTAVIFCVCLSPSAFAKYGGGTGEPNDPYRIYDANQFNTIGLDSNDWDKSFLLMNDIDLGAYSGTQYNPIGAASGNAFMGDFDGNSKIVRNFSYNDPNRENLGLFGYVGPTGSIHDLAVVDANVLGDSTVGIIAGGNQGLITDCTAGGKVTGDIYVAGVVGINWANLTKCSNLSDVNAITYSCGGLTGNNRGTIFDSCNTGNINSGMMAGGVVGYNLGTISNCYNRGAVAASENCGGLIGKNRDTVTNCYSAAPISSAGSYVGAVIGYTTVPLGKCFWDTQVCPDVNGVGNVDDPDVVGKTTAQMKTPQTFLDAGWDLFSHWNAVAGQYPDLFMYLLDYPGGDGSESDPFQIAIGPQLLVMGADTGNYDKHFILTADIDMAGCITTTAIIAPDSYNTSYGFDGTSFTGVFDGQGHTIYNLKIDGGAQNDYIGLFGSTESHAVVRNINIEDANVIGDKCVGILAGLNNLCDVNNCSASGYMRGNSEKHYGAGGLIGLNYQGTVSNSSSNVIVSGKEYVGGLIGFSWIGDITNCSSVATVTGDLYVGGLIGGIDNAKVRDCSSDGSVSATEYETGGLVGTNSGGTITNCIASGTVTGFRDVGGLIGLDVNGSVTGSRATGSTRGSFHVGGLIGRATSSTVTDCNSAIGQVAGARVSSCVGGLVGDFYDSNATNCYSNSNVSGGISIGGLLGESNISSVNYCFAKGTINGSEYVGGLIGANDLGTVTKSYAVGDVSGSWEVGGLIGRNDGDYLHPDSAKVENCYSAGTVNGNTYVGAFVGYQDEDEMIKCFWDANTCPGLNGSGSGGDPMIIESTTALMQSEVTFTNEGWDFVGETVNGPNDVWAICEGTNYPKLAWSIPRADIVCPDGVDFVDYSYLANAWATADPNADIDQSGIVDPNDLQILSEDWLKGF